MLKGSCLCGAVRYEISAPIHEIHHCHCSMCRKSHGTPFSTFGRIDKEAFRLTAGNDRVRAYKSSPSVERSFCSVCGSHLLFAFAPLPDALWVTIGTLDDDPGVRPDGHMFVKSKAPWFEITDRLAQYDEYPPNPGD